MKRVAICTAQVPFVWGGAEIHVESLARELREHGFEVEIIRLPFKWYPRQTLINGCLAWRLIDLSESGGRPIDLVIATKFPSYVVQHPNKVVWLIHQYRAAYDLFGTPFSDLTTSPEDLQFRDIIRRIDKTTLSEARRIFTNSKNTAARLAQFNGLHGEPLYHPPQHDGRYHNAGYSDYVFAVSRLEPVKRLDGLLRTMQYTTTHVRAVIAGTGPEADSLQKLAHKLQISDRVEFPGFVDDDDLIDLYAHALAVYYAPFNEDYGYVTLEAFRSRKPVLTTPDSGGVLEFVADGETGCVAALNQPAAMAARIDQLFADRKLAARLGDAGHAAIQHITWETAIQRLTEGL